MVDSFYRDEILATKLRELIVISATGMRPDLDQGLCSTSWIGFTSSIFSMTPPLSIPTHSSHSQKDATRFFPSGCLRLWRGNQKLIQPGTTRHARPRAGFVLPQDFTLFLLLREQTPDIWLQKIDWIAKHGGMALVNVHPDYLCLNGSTPKAMEYPSTHYKALLDYVRERYDGVFWNPTPRKVAQFFAEATNVSKASES